MNKFLSNPIKIIIWTKKGDKFNKKVISCCKEIKKGGDPLFEIDLTSIDSIIPTTKVNKVNSNIKLYPEDTIMDLKKKISVALGIDLYKQHLFTIEGPLMYKFYIDNIEQHIDIFEKQSKNTYGIPSDVYYYNNKNCIRILANDEFEILNNLNTNEINLISCDEWFTDDIKTDLVSQYKNNDTYQIKIIYYSFILKFYPMMSLDIFIEYLHNQDIRKTYPLVALSSDNLKYLDYQNNIMDKLGYVSKNFKISISKASIKITSPYQKDIINMRMLFDNLHTNHIMSVISMIDVYNNKHIKIVKNHFSDMDKIKHVDPHSIKIKILTDTTELYTTFYKNGSYIITGCWREDIAYTFELIHKDLLQYIQPIVDIINNIKSSRLLSRYKLPNINKFTSKFVDISLNMYWKKTFTIQDFNKLKRILDDYYVKSKILKTKSSETSVMEFYFIKGMYEFDSSRLCKITDEIIINQYIYLIDNDIKTKWETLFENIRIFKISHRSSDIKLEISGIKEDEFSIYQKFIHLLEQLNSEIKIDDSDKTQTVKNIKALSSLKEQDPMLFNLKKIYNSDEVYSKLCQKSHQPQISDSGVKYWNFTNNEPIYYKCPNKQYPYLGFIGNKHPKKYCLPCCYKTPPPKKTDKTKSSYVYHTCLNDYIMSDDKFQESSSRYIINYGKSIQVGRIGNVPESTLYKIFNDEFGKEMTNKYYLYGVDQVYKNVKMGFIWTLVHILDMDFLTFIEDCIKRIKLKPELYKLILGGRLALKYPIKEFLSNILTIDNLNIIFIDIAKYYYNITPIIFRDYGSKIQIYIKEYIQNFTDLITPKNKYLLVLYNNQTEYWNPIYIINKDLYFRSQIINQKTFSYNDDGIRKILSVIAHSFGEELSVVKTPKKTINFDIMYEVITHYNYTIESLFHTIDNKCYGVSIKNIGYIPFHATYINFNNYADIKTETQITKLPTKDNLFKFVSKYNKYIKELSNKKGFAKINEDDMLIYPLIDLSTPVEHNGKIILFRYDDINFYIKPYSGKAQQKISYNPIYLNKIVYKNKYKKVDSVVDNLLIKHHQYDIIKLKLSDYFNTHENTKLRNQIIEIIKKSRDLKKIRELLNKEYDDCDLLSADMNKIKNHFNNKNIVESFTNDYYNFDNTYLNKIKKLPTNDIFKILKGIIKNDKKSTNVKNFINENSIYKSDNILKIIASELKNKFISDEVFSPANLIYLMDYFKFNKNQNETIIVDFI